MAFDRLEFLSVLEDSYTAYYNIYKQGLPSELPMVFLGEYFQRGEKYWLSKNIPIYGNETNEYVYAFSAPLIDGETAKKCIDYALEDGLPRVKPHKEHQYTNIKVIFIAEKYDSEAIEEIKKRKFQKSYHYSLWGYSNLITAAVDVNAEKVYVNRAGDEMKKYFKKLFAAQKKED